MEDKKVVIIGAGVAGLVAAIELEKAGFKPTLLEASNSAGGRIKTDHIDGYLLDHGFQVLLTAYPEAKRYLDYEALNLKTFDPGALIYPKEGDPFTVADPLRQPLKALNMLFSPVGTFGDKLKIYSWNSQLKRTSVEDLFKKPETTSLKFLRQKGFSEQIIDNFFKPFFGGIFLENDLSTSSRMLEFVFKMFGEGHAAIPSGGMQKIPEQLLEQLDQTDVQFGKKVKSVGLRELTLTNGETIQADAFIIATNPANMLPQLQDQVNGHQEVVNLYFSSNVNPVGKPTIALACNEEMLINNFCVMNNVSTDYAADGSYLISISVTQDFQLSDDALKKKVIDELVALVPIMKEAEITHLKTFYIDQALPQIDDFQYSMKPSNCKIQDGVYLAGDYLLNGSINAAMLSGRLAAHAVFEDFKGDGFRN
ncbi:NAD(P)/FAD-dependent oxidoreductase [Marivirga atlantica]|jgi:phytoene dehydrogenase-like protein|uniref:FAD-dependent oxidoreductase n=1 Tax=Marivirga atlantica TaxID=1548457 RepID=A0A937ADL0_9BACT|nr:NAD(P)/FAD-dependent oxidoreductase [Marivirga atlantica]MBL0767066.1 FAD-dependent oxidoreductase [Marivirga atlantica]